MCSECTLSLGENAAQGGDGTHCKGGKNKSGKSDEVSKWSCLTWRHICPGEVWMWQGTKWRGSHRKSADSLLNISHHILPFQSVFPRMAADVLSSCTLRKVFRMLSQQIKNGKFTEVLPRLPSIPLRSWKGGGQPSERDYWLCLRYGLSVPALKSLLHHIMSNPCIPVQLATCRLIGSRCSNGLSLFSADSCLPKNA